LAESARQKAESDVIASREGTVANAKTEFDDSLGRAMK
jgi:hypothetical protein